MADAGVRAPFLFMTPFPRAPAGQAARRDKILVRGVNWLGDAIMTTPALYRLREAQPAAHLTLLTHEKLGELWQTASCIDSVIRFTSHDSVWPLGRRLRAEGFTTVLVLPNSPRSAIEGWVAGIPRRIGAAGPWRNWFLTEVIPPRIGEGKMRQRTVREIHRLIRWSPRTSPTIWPPQAHQVHHYLNLVSFLGGNPAPIPPRLEISDAEAHEIGSRLNLLEQTDERGPIIGLNAGAEFGPAKRWPRERFLAAAIEVGRRISCRWVLFGGKSDIELASGLAEQIKLAFRRLNPALPDASERAVINLAGRTSLRELCAALKMCRVLLTNDTGPMHVAAAVGTPVVALFGSTSPELTGPGFPDPSKHYTPKSSVPCAPCFRRVCPIDFRCMQAITVDQVVAAILRVLGE